MKKFITFRESPDTLMERFISLNIQHMDSEVANTYTIDELVVLFELMSQEGLCQNAIAQKIHKNKSTIKRTLDKLEKKNAIIRLVDKNDSRKYNIFLGDNANYLKEKFSNGLDEDIKWYKSCLGEEEYKHFMELLNILYDKSLECPKKELRTNK